MPIQAMMRGERILRQCRNALRFLLLDGRLTEMGVDNLFQLSHKRSQGLVASVQAAAYHRASRHGFLIRIPGLI
jgi:hypothetical protein